MLARLRPVEFIRPVGSGRTKPVLVSCEDAEGETIDVVAKFSGGPEASLGGLVREVVAACLAGHLRLPVPEPFLLDIEPAWVETVRDMGQRELIRSSSGVAFGSRHLGPQYVQWNSAMKLVDENVETAAGIFVFDALTQNPDRRENNPNCLVKGAEIRIIDHELALGRTLPGMPSLSCRGRKGARMTLGRPYTYRVLRYVHDVVTGEFVNVGVLMHVASDAVPLRAEVRSVMGDRLRTLFPGIDRKAFSEALGAVKDAAQALAAQMAEAPLPYRDLDAGALSLRLLPADDSALQWSSSVGSGLTHDPARTLARLYERFVTRYEHRPTRRRSDDAVWAPLQRKLNERGAVPKFEEVRLRGAADEIVFRHAWRNGLLHAYEPLSFDLANSEEIRGKARARAGHLLAVEDVLADVKTVFIVGRPSSPELYPAFEAAVAILDKAPGHSSVVEEDDIDTLVSDIAAEWERHRTDVGH